MSFESWWNEHGSAFAPQESEDYEDHARRVSRIAWEYCIEQCARICEKQDGFHDSIYAEAIRSEL